MELALKYVPTKQLTHAVEPRPGANAPAAHAVHAIAELPAGYCPPPWADVKLTYVPAAHRAHEDVPVVEAAYEPTVQVVQADAPDAKFEYAPGTQAVHAETPVAALYVPTLQIMQGTTDTMRTKWLLPSAT